jgi:hypothetical protein
VPRCRCESLRVGCTTFSPLVGGSSCCGGREAQLLRRIRVMGPELSLLAKFLARFVYEQAEGRSTCSGGHHYSHRRNNTLWYLTFQSC